MTDVVHGHMAEELPPTAQASKAEWREWARRRRLQLPPPDSAAICSALLEFLTARGVQSVLAYHALPGEPDISALRGHLRLYTTRAVFKPQPRLSLHRWESASELSRFGTKQPPRGTPEVYQDEIGAVLLPGLAFDQSGWRLGYGGGFYDRMLQGWKVLSIGVVPGGLLVSALPHEPHDLPVDFLATELGVKPVPKNEG